MQRPELAELIEGAIGEGSPFHDQFGYYAQGVGPETAIINRIKLSAWLQAQRRT